MKKVSPEKEVPKHRNKKNTKLWCKGKEGKPHDYVWVVHNRYISVNRTFNVLNYACSNCGKVDSTFYNFDKEYYETPVIGSREPLKEKVKEI